MFNDDSIRPLSEEGKVATQDMAFFLKTAGYAIDTVWHSPYLRTSETADIIADVFDIQTERELLLSPFAKEEYLLDKVANTLQNIAIVGHSPSLQRLLHLMTEGKASPIDIETSSAIIIEKADDRLKAIYVHPHTFIKINLL